MKALDNKREIDQLDREIGDIATQINELRTKLVGMLHRKNILEHEQREVIGPSLQIDRRVQKVD